MIFVVAAGQPTSRVSGGSSHIGPVSTESPNPKEETYETSFRDRASDGSDIWPSPGWLWRDANPLAHCDADACTPNLQPDARAAHRHPASADRNTYSSAYRNAGASGRYANPHFHSSASNQHSDSHTPNQYAHTSDRYASATDSDIPAQTHNSADKAPGAYPDGGSTIGTTP